MKKLISILLAFCLLIGLAACGGGEEPRQTQAPATSGADTGETTAPASVNGAGVFRAGYAMVDITPTENVPMNGFSNSSERISAGIMSYLYAISLAVQDENGNTAVICAVDICSLHDQWVEPAIEQLITSTGLPRENIVVCALHQHSCPDPVNTEIPSSKRYCEQLTAGVVKSVESAIADLAPSELYINTATTEAMSFVRNYIMNDGTIAGSNYGSFSSGIKSHESESDKEMRMVKFVREGADDIILVNFQSHPHLGSTPHYNDVHSDWPGIIRDTVKEKLGANCIYISGAGGNLNSDSRITAENISKNYKEHGQRGAQYVIDAEDSYVKVEAGPVVCVQETISYKADHTMDHMLEAASAMHQARLRSTAEAEAMLKNHPEFHSIYHASAVVSKAAQPENIDVTIGVISFGDVAITAHPYEMFDTNGMELRSGSVGNANYDADDQLENPYKMTIIASLSNYAWGYIPSRLGYTNGGYSTDITKFAPGTGEQLVGDYLRLLNELHQ